MPNDSSSELAEESSLSDPWNKLSGSGLFMDGGLKRSTSSGWGAKSTERSTFRILIAGDGLVSRIFKRNTFSLKDTEIIVFDVNVANRRNMDSSLI